MTSRLEVPADQTKEQSALGKVLETMNVGETKSSGISEKSAARSTERSATGSDLYTKFVWGAGIECSFIPHLGVDQFEWTQHDPLSFEATYDPDLGYLTYLKMDISDVENNEYEITVDCLAEGTGDDVCPFGAGGAGGASGAGGAPGLGGAG